METISDVSSRARVHLSFLRDITDGFSEDRVIRKAGFGDVYKGIHGDGQLIAVMKLYPVVQEIDDKQFQQEFLNLKKLCHRNIVRLLSYCYEKTQILVPYNGRLVFAHKTHMAVCFEYLSNGTLDQYVTDTSSGLDWHSRFRIIKDICEGIRYLHEARIIHMDLKPCNILLDQNMEAKIGDFGLQRLLGEGNVRRIGTTGYMPPEFIERQVITHKFDIYSVGVIIIELMTGSRPGTNDVYSDKFTELVLVKWKERLRKTVNGMSVETYCQQVTKCLKIALKCVEYDNHERPSIGEIVHRLKETEGLIQEEVQAVQNDSRKSLLLDVHPQELCFSFTPKGRKKAVMSSSCLLRLNNKGNNRVAFMLVSNNPKRYLTKKPLCGIVPPRCTYTLTLTMTNKQRLLSGITDFYTLRSIMVSQQDLLHVDTVQYTNFFKKAQETAGAANKVQVATLNVRCDRPAAESAGTPPETIIRPDTQQISSIDVHPTEPWIMTTNHVGSLSLWDYNTMATLNAIHGSDVTDVPVHVAKFIAREKWLVIGDRNGNIYVYNYERNRDVKSFDAHFGCLTTLVVHPTHPFVLSSSDENDDHLIKLWDWDKGWKCTRKFQGHTDRVTQVTFNPENKDIFVSTSWDGTIKIWSIRSNNPNNLITMKLDGPAPESLFCVSCFTRRNRQHLIVGCEDATAQIWELDVKRCIHKLEGHADRITAVNMHPEIPMLITGSLDGTVRLWNSTTYRLENIIGLNLGAVYAFGCIRGSTRIVVGCEQGIAMMEVSSP